MTKKYTTIFLGTPEFAVPSLKELIKSPSFSVLAVFTQKDKAKGRKLAVTASPVKKLAQKENIPIYQPEKIKEAKDLIKNLKPDLLVVVAYGQILPEEILNISKYKCINVHASLLPLYRGASCISAPILNNDKYTGVTIMEMDKGMDTGNIIRQEKIKLDGQVSAGELHDKLAKLGADILIPSLLDYCQGKIKSKKQEDKKATYVKLTKKTDGKINWQEPAYIIDRKIRAYQPWPGTYCQLDDNQTLKILEAKLSDDKETLKPGEVKIKNKQLLVGTGQANLTILKLQKSGQKPLKAQDFILGNNLDAKILK